MKTNIKKELFAKQKKELTSPVSYTLKKSIIEKIKEISKEENLSESKVVNTILDDFFNKD